MAGVAKDSSPLQGANDFLKALFGLVIIFVVGIAISSGIFHHWWYFPVAVAVLVGYVAISTVAKRRG